MMLRPTFFAANVAVGCVILFLVLVGLTTRGVPDFRIPGRDQSKKTAASAYLDDVSNSTLGVRCPFNAAEGSWLTMNKFQKVFAINLPARTDHRDALLLTSAVSGIEVDWIDGVEGKDVLEKAMPQPGKDINAGNIGSWRAHLNALQESVYSS